MKLRWVSKTKEVGYNVSTSIHLNVAEVSLIDYNVIMKYKLQ